MLHFFLQCPPSALGFGTMLVGLIDEIVLAVPSITFVLVVPSFGLSRVGSGGFLGGAFLLLEFGGLRGIFKCGGLRIVAVAVVTDRPIGWIRVVFIG